MKRFIMAIVAIAAIAMVGCSKDDEKGTATLSGTTWEGTNYYDDGEYETLKLEYTSNTGVVITVMVHDEYGTDAETQKGTYTLNGSTVDMVFDFYDYPVTFTGKIKGSTMDVYEDDDFLITVKKK